MCAAPNQLKNKSMETTTLSTAAPSVECRALFAAIGPVMDWYQSDEHPDRDPLEIISDIVSDLQSDRKAALIAASAADDALALCHHIERCGCSEELTKASIMASALRAKLALANDKAVPTSGADTGENSTVQKS